MNWSRAKTILIAALIITNAFLLVTYGDFNFNSDEFRDHKALSEFLAQKNIFVDAEIIPKENRDMPVLFVQNLEIDHDKINSALQSIAFEPPPPGEREDADYIAAADLCIYLLGLHEDAAVFKDIAENAVISRVERNDAGLGIVMPSATTPLGEDEAGIVQTKVIYKNVIDGMAIERSHITLFFEEGVPVYIGCEWLEALHFHNRRQPTISAAQALLLFLAQIEETKTIYINSIEMIYWLDETIIAIETAGSVDTAFPAWKITYNEVSRAGVVYIHAYQQ